MSNSLNIDDLLTKIAAAGDAGVTLAKIMPRQKAGAKGAREAEMREALAELVRNGSIRGPFKKGNSQLYFAAGRGPTVDAVCAHVERLVMNAGTKLLSKKALQDKVKGLEARYFADALKQAASKRSILEIACGNSKYYLHRDVAAERFGLLGDPESPATGWDLTFAELATVYRRLKDEQGGFTAVKIFDVIKALNAPQADVHRLIAEEAKAGRVAIHPTNSVNLPREVMDAALRLPGHAEPFVTMAVREER
jgi:hypothetical protein